MRSMRTLLTGTALALLATTAHDATAQLNSQRVRERYERNTKGGDIGDYIRRLDSDDPLERIEAIRSLEESNSPEAIEYLVGVLGDPDMRIRARAVDSLGNMRAIEATPVLIQQLFLRDNPELFKQRTLAALGKIGDPRAVESILEFMKRDLTSETRGTAIFALGEIGAGTALPELEKIRDESESPHLRRLARQAIGKVQYRQDVQKSQALQPQTTFLKPDQPPGPPQ